MGEGMKDVSAGQIAPPMKESEKHCHRRESRGEHGGRFHVKPTPLNLSAMNSYWEDGADIDMDLTALRDGN